MASYLKFVLVALVCTVVGVPLWTALLAPDALSLTFFTEMGFWVAAGIGMVLLLFGFRLGNRADAG